MKNFNLALLFFFGFTSLKVSAQVPGISYQAVIMSADGKALPGKNDPNLPLANQEICLKFSFINAAGENEYEEVIQTKTDPYGMVNVIIGTGNPAGGIVTSFDQIKWNSQAKSLTVALDKNGACSDFKTISTQQFTAVPFAFFAVNSGTPGPVGPAGPAGPVGAQGPGGIGLSDLTSGLATKVDKVTGKELSSNDYTTAEKTKLAAITGTNTGDQDLSALATTADLTSGLLAKVDKVTGKELSSNDYTADEKTKLAAITGTNTGDQDLSALATVDLLASKASLSSPTFTGIPLAPTAALGTNNTQIATTAYVDAAVTSVTAGSAFTGTAPISILSGAVSLNDNGITTSKIANNAVTSAKIPDQAINTAKIANGAVTIAKLPAGATAITFLRGDGTWALPAINTGSTSIVLNGLSFERAAFTGEVTAAQNTNALIISNAAVTTAKLFDGAVTSIKIADNAVTVAKIANNAVTGAKIADGAVTGAKVAVGTIANTNLVNVPSKTFKGRTDVSDGVVQDLTVAQVKTDLAINLVDNTSDLLKPISTATQNALDLKANLASPALTGSPTAPTQTAGDNSTKVATTAYVDAVSQTIFSTRVSLSSAAAPAPVGSSLFNFYTLTEQTVNATFNSPSGIPLDGNSLVLKIKASTAEIALAWNAIYRGGTDISLPTITNKTMVLHFMYNAADGKWDMVGITNGI